VILQDYVHAGFAKKRCAFFAATQKINLRKFRDLWKCRHQQITTLALQYAAGNDKPQAAVFPVSRQHLGATRQFRQAVRKNLDIDFRPCRIQLSEQISDRAARSDHLHGPMVYVFAPTPANLLPAPCTTVAKFG